VHRSRFALRATAAHGERAFLFVAEQDGYDAREVPRGTVVTGQGWFVPATVGTEASIVTFDQVRRTTTEVAIASNPGHAYVEALLAMLSESDEVDRLRAIADRLEVVHATVGRVQEDLRVEREALEERRGALDALRTVSSGGSIRARLAQAVAQGVGRVDDLAREATELHAEDIALRQEWYGLLRALTVAPR
jgi:hypothetical protein